MIPRLNINFLGAACLTAALACNTSHQLQQTAPDERAEIEEAPTTARAQREERLDMVMDRVHFAFRPRAGGFEARHSTHSARVDVGALRITPTDHAGGVARKGAVLDVETTSIYRGDAGIDVTYRGATVDAASGRLVIERAGVTEELKNFEGGVEQSWRFAAEPDGAGDLVVEVALLGHDLVAENDRGIHLAVPGKLGFRYSHGLWIDAAGVETPVVAAYQNGAVKLTVPEDVLVASAFPAVLDPTIEAERAVDAPVVGPTGVASASPAVAASGDGFLVVWSDRRNGQENDIWGTRLTLAGAVLDPLGLEIRGAGGVQDNPVVAFSGGQYVVAFDDGADIGAATVTTAGVVTVLPDVQTFAGAPAIAAGQGGALLAYMQGATVRAALFDGGSFGATFEVATGAPAGPTVAGNLTGGYLVGWSDGLTAANARARLVDAAGVPSGESFDVSAAAGAQTQLDASFDGTSFVVAWTNPAPDGTDIYGTRVTTAGVVIDTRVEDAVTVGGVVMASAPKAQSLPTIECVTDQCLLAWNDRRAQATTGFDLWARTLGTAAAGAPTPAVEFLLAGQVQDQRAASLAASGTSWYAVWNDERSGGPQVAYGAAVTGDGTVTPASGTLLGTGNNRQGGATVASSGTNLLVAWSDSRAEGDDILAVRYRFGGAALDATARAVSDEPARQSSPDAARHASGTVVVWNDARNGFDDDIYLARVGADGNTADASGIPVSTVTRDQLFPEVASDGTSALVVWQDRRTSNFDIYAALVGPDGTLSASDIPVCVSDGDQHRPSVAYDPASSTYLVAWQDGRAGVVGASDIYAARVSSTGDVLEPCGVALSQAPSSQHNPDVVNAEGTFLVTWEDRRIDGVGDIYAARVTIGGGVLSIADAAGIAVATGPSSQHSPVATFIAGGWMLAWTDNSNQATHGTDIVGVQLSESGIVQGVPFAIANGIENERLASIAGGESSNGLVSYERDVSTLDATRVFVRRIATTNVTLGAACSTDAQCDSGFCVDSRCCDSACGGTTLNDCQACSASRGAVADGTCSVVPAGRVCRQYVDTFCDRREVCDGVSAECPPDLGRREGDVCDMACGAVCPENGVAGAPHDCPPCT